MWIEVKIKGQPTMVNASRYDALIADGSATYFVRYATGAARDQTLSVDESHEAVMEKIRVQQAVGG